MPRRILLTCISLVLLAACAPAPSVTLIPSLTPRPQTATPSPTLLAIPVASSPTQLPATPTPEIVSPTPELVADTLEPAPTETLFVLPTFVMPPTLAATDIPQPAVDSGAIQLIGPGPLSKNVSPVKAYGYSIPGYGNKGRLDLYAEDGRVLASQVVQLNSIYRWAYFYWELPFTIDTAGELGRLSMSTKDQYGRVTALYSVHLLLLSEGASIINPPGNLRERCVIDNPYPGKRNAGGALTVAGSMRPYNDLPLTIELITRDGRTIGSQQVDIAPTAKDSYVAFHANVPYSLSSGAWALLVVRQPDDRISGTMYLYSQEIFLNP